MISSGVKTLWLGHDHSRNGASLKIGGTSIAASSGKSAWAQDSTRMGKTTSTLFLTLRELWLAVRQRDSSTAGKRCQRRADIFRAMSSATQENPKTRKAMALSTAALPSIGIFILIGIDPPPG